MPVTLTFEKAGSIDTFLHVQAVGATEMGKMPGMKMDNPKTETNPQ